MTQPVIETPAFITIQLADRSSIRGRFVRYADPTSMATGRGGMTTAWFAEDEAGVQTFIPWSAITMLTAFPLDSPEAQGAKPGVEVGEDKPA